MVIVVTGCGEPVPVAEALAVDLGWRLVAVAPAGQTSTQDLHAAAERAVDRREPLVIAWPHLPPADRDRLRRLRGVRVVVLERPPAAPVQPEQDVRLDAAGESAALARLIRHELGR